MSPTIMLRCWMCGITIVEAELDTIGEQIIAKIGQTSSAFCSDCHIKMKPFIWLLTESKSMKFRDPEVLR